MLCALPADPDARNYDPFDLSAGELAYTLENKMRRKFLKSSGPPPCSVYAPRAAVADIFMYGLAKQRISPTYNAAVEAPDVCDSCK